MEKIESELVKISPSWHELQKLIENAKTILKEMSTVTNQEINFSEQIYEQYKNQFWQLINFREVTISPHQNKEN